MGRGDAAGVLIGDEQQPLRLRLAEDGIQLLLFCLRRKLAVQPARGDFVPGADAAGIGLAEIKLFMLIQHDPRRRIVHHRGAIVAGSGKIVTKAQRMADFMRGQLANAIQCQFDRIIVAAAAGFGRACQPLENHAIVTDALRAQDDMALDELAAARINDAAAIGPATRLSMHPLHDVVADVQRVRISGQNFHPVSIGKTGSGKGFLPPTGTIKQRLLDGCWRTGVNVEHNRLTHAAGRITRLHMLQPVAHGNTAQQRLMQRCGVVVETQRKGAAARIGAAWLVAGWRQAHKAVVLAQRDMIGIGCGGADLGTGLA